MRGRELGGERAVLVDGALDELREVRHEQQVLGEVGLRGLLAVVDVDHVSRCLEGEERDAQGQHEPEGAGARHEVVQDGVPVLEVAEHAQADGERGDEHEALAHLEAGLHGLLLGAVGDGLAGFLAARLEHLERTGGTPGDGRGEHHEDEGLPAAGDRIEHEARGEQDAPLLLGRNASEHVVCAPRAAEEYEELDGEELHATPRAR